LLALLSFLLTILLYFFFLPWCDVDDNDDDDDAMEEDGFRKGGSMPQGRTKSKASQSHPEIQMGRDKTGI
jgi:hypothetical protein